MRPRGLTFEGEGELQSEVECRAVQDYLRLGLACAVTVRRVFLVEGNWFAEGRTEEAGDHYLVTVVTDACAPSKVVSHELRHVWQLETGRLALHEALDRPARQYWRWDGGPWCSEFPEYESRPWERDARLWTGQGEDFELLLYNPQSGEVES